MRASVVERIVARSIPERCRVRSNRSNVEMPQNSTSAPGASARMTHSILLCPTLRVLFVHLLFGMLKHLRRIDILPPRIADLHGPHFSIACHQTNAISQTAIIVLFGFGQIVKELERAN